MDGCDSAQDRGLICIANERVAICYCLYFLEHAQPAQSRRRSGKRPSGTRSVNLGMSGS